MANGSTNEIIRRPIPKEFRALLRLCINTVPNIRVMAIQALRTEGECPRKRKYPVSNTKTVSEAAFLPRLFQRKRRVFRQ